MRDRAILSLVCLIVFSIVSKLWMSQTLHESNWVTEIMQRCERSRITAMQEKEDKNVQARHLGYCIGLCEAAKVIMSDENIEDLTGINMETYMRLINRRLMKSTRKMAKRIIGPKAS